MGFHGALAGGGSAYDDTAVLASIAALQANQIWVVNSAAAGTAAGPVASFLVENLSTTKRSLVTIKWSQTGANATSGIEFEPNDVAGDGDGAYVRYVAAASGEYDGKTAGAIAWEAIVNGTDCETTFIIDPVRKIGSGTWTHGAGSSPFTTPPGGVFSLQWTEAGIDRFRLNQLSASATFTTASWKVWTENV